MDDDHKGWAPVAKGRVPRDSGIEKGLTLSPPLNLTLLLPRDLLEEGTQWKEAMRTINFQYPPNWRV
jgi:hypothetical protein